MESLYELDQVVFRAIHVGLHSAASDVFFAALSYSGLSQVQLVFVFSLWRSRETKPWIWPTVAAIGISGIVYAQGLKNLMPRDRPSNMAYTIPQESWTLGSFPSGHTTTSFALATMLVLFSQGTRFARWSWLSLIWALLVGISRIYRGVHWPTDTLAGACGGIAVAALVYSLKPKEE